MMKKSFQFLLIFLVSAICVSDSAAAFEYSSGGRRDPFVPLVGVVSTGAKGGVMSVLTIDDVIFQGIIVDPEGHRSAIINGEIMKQGDKIERVEIVEVGTTYVKIKVNEEVYSIDLYD